MADNTRWAEHFEKAVEAAKAWEPMESNRDSGYLASIRSAYAYGYAAALEYIVEEVRKWELLHDMHCDLSNCRGLEDLPQPSERNPCRNILTNGASCMKERGHAGSCG